MALAILQWFEIGILLSSVRCGFTVRYGKKIIINSVRGLFYRMH